MEGETVYLKRIQILHTALYKADLISADEEELEEFLLQANFVSTINAVSCDSGEGECSYRVDIPSTLSNADVEEPYALIIPNEDKYEFNFKEMNLGEFEVSGLVKFGVLPTEGPTMITLQPVDATANDTVATKYECTKSLANSGAFVGWLGCVF